MKASNASSAPWSSTPSLHRSISLAVPSLSRCCLMRLAGADGEHFQAAHGWAVRPVEPQPGTRRELRGHGAGGSGEPGPYRWLPRYVHSGCNRLRVKIQIGFSRVSIGCSKPKGFQFSQWPATVSVVVGSVGFQVRLMVQGFSVGFNWAPRKLSQVERLTVSTCCLNNSAGGRRGGGAEAGGGQVPGAVVQTTADGECVC
jgi:hypothetical protein